MRHPSHPRPTLVGLVASLLLLLCASSVATAETIGPERLVRAPISAMPDSTMLVDVVAGGPGFIAVGQRIDQTNGAMSAQIWTSGDGVAWSAVPLSGASATGQIRGVAALSDGYIAVGGRCCADQGLVWRSPDGLTWTVDPDAAALANAALFSVAELSDGTVVAVGCAAAMECGGGLAWRSEDGGATWSDPVALPGLLLDIAATSFGAVAVGATEPYEAAPMTATTTDGVSWTGTPLPGPMGTMSGVVATDGGAIALGSSQRSLGARPRSLVAVTEGTAWGTVSAGRMQAATFQAGARRAASLPTDPALLVAGGWVTPANGVPRPAAWWSTDATTWQRIAIGSNQGQVMGIAVGADGTVVAVGWVGRDDSTGAVWSAAPVG